jgi:hypothetical protein
VLLHASVSIDELDEVYGVDYYNFTLHEIGQSWILKLHENPKRINFSINN